MIFDSLMMLGRVGVVVAVTLSRGDPLHLLLLLLPPPPLLLPYPLLLLRFPSPLERGYVTYPTSRDSTSTRTVCSLLLLLRNVCTPVPPRLLM